MAITSIIRSRWTKLAAAVALAAGIAIPVAQATSSTPTPSANTCASLNAAPQGGADSLDYIFTIGPASGASATGFTFNFGDSTTFEGQATDVSKEHIYTQAGTYLVTAQVKTASGLSAVTDNCSVTITVGPTNTTPATPTPTPTQTPAPVAPVATPSVSPVAQDSTDPLPTTGPESALAGIGGFGAIGYASRAYLRSRKSLIKSLRKQK